MESKAIQRYVRITPRKCNQVLDLIRGESVEHAQTTLQFTPKLGDQATAGAGGSLALPTPVTISGPEENLKIDLPLPKK